jgi:hypothetical protein
LVGIITLDFLAIWYAADLDHYSGDSGFNLVSINKKVFCLQVQAWKHLLIIAESSLESGPATIALANDDFLKLKACLNKNSRGLYKKGSLLIKNENEVLRLSWRKSITKAFSPAHFIHTDKLLIRSTLDTYRAILAEMELSSSATVLLEMKGGEDYFRQQIAHNYPLLVESLLSHNKEAFIKYSRRLVGMGRGLTPTGDDLLHGALVTFHYFINDTGFMESVKNEFAEAVFRTNIFGRHALEIAIRGLTPEVFSSFLRTIDRGKADRELLNRIISFGSSSGLDIVIAMVFFLKKIADQ